MAARKPETENSLSSARSAELANPVAPVAHGASSNASQRSDGVSPNTEPTVLAPSGSETSRGLPLGLFIAGTFYGGIWAFPNAWMQRFFLGHPVCIGATILFAVALGILIVKALRVRSETRLCRDLRDQDLAPRLTPISSGDQWVLAHDAGRVAGNWLHAIAELPSSVRRARLVKRLAELLERQRGRSSTRQLADDQRELAGRDADQAHDSLQLVRIIVWAIPMLGFLGTVVGITQTLGGLDFTDGNAAVDRLKSGLYVAFDTTALGLVLSVVAIFLQYPVEQAEQSLLGEIDLRVGRLLTSKLPSAENQDNPAAHIAELCEGIRVAVAESLESQTKLWRQTIDEAHAHWQQIAVDHGDRIGEALNRHLDPLLQQHVFAVDQQSQAFAAQVQEITKHTGVLNAHSQLVREQMVQDVEQADALREMTATTAQVQQLVIQQQNDFTAQLRAIQQQHRDTQDLLALQAALDQNLHRLADTNAAVQQSIENYAGHGIAPAIMTLARVVDLLATRLPDHEIRLADNSASDDDSAEPIKQRRAA